jgi:hypothetical protein
MLTFTTEIEARTVGDLELALEAVLERIKQGYTSGFEPPFDLTGEEEDENEEE